MRCQCKNYCKNDDTNEVISVHITPTNSGCVGTKFQAINMPIAIPMIILIT
jgi:hypothetical protein